MLTQIIRRQFEPGHIYKVIIRKYHQFKPKDKIQAFDAPLPHDIQVYCDIKFVSYTSEGP